jgi:predicted metal-dependent HD superfamily phosphohydrolase
MWSKLVNTPIGIFVKRFMSDSKRKYHNFGHILDCYSFLEKIGYPYSVELDYAILFHDVIYDNLPEKEIRSAKFFVEQKIKFVDTDKVYDLILATIDHDFTLWSDREDRDFKAIIMTDLHQLGDPLLVIKNYGLIMEEICMLNDIHFRQFAKGNLEFMSALSHRLHVNSNFDQTNDNFWSNIRDGVDLTMEISRGLLK